MRRFLIAVSLLAWASQGVAANSTLSQQQERARQQRAALQERIRVLQADIAQRDKQRQAADQALRESESAISDISRRLAELEASTRAVHERLEQLQREHEEDTKRLAHRREELAAQLRGQYLGSLSPWTALLSGDDPHAIGRNLAYLGYVSRAQAQAVKAVDETLQRLQRNQKASEQEQNQLKQLTVQTHQQRTQLEQKRAERKTALDGIEEALRVERQQAKTLEADDQRLEQLINELGVAMKEQAEQERQARERARREAEEAAKEAARTAAKKAARETETAPAPPAADGDAKKPPAQAPAGKLRRPVQGAIQGRFGAARPEGGVWRGIVIRAPEGTGVKVVAAGRVAYASWLSGFGNILIVDHGEQLMSVYAYNQGLLKEVGDLVESGEVIATVGATGGQVESGLYFELRQKGKPVNPELWLTD